MLAGPAANFLLAIGILALIFANSIERQFILEVGEIPDSYLVQNTQLRQGDELIAINNKSVSSLQEVRLELLSFAGASGYLDLTFKSKNGSRQFEVPIPVKNFLSSVESQANPELFLGFNLAIKLQPIVGVISSDSMAGQNGLKVNDRILEVNSLTIKSFEDLAGYLNSYQDSEIDLKVQRSDQIIYLNIPLGTRINGEGFEEKFIGIMPGMKRSLASSIFKGIYETYNLSAKTLTFVGKMITQDLSTQNLSGPIGIVQMAGDTAKGGLLPFLYLMALLSISLGVLNLLPIPVLDGGQLVMLGVEAIRGSPMPERMESFFYMFGWIAVGSLMIFAIFNDISKFL
jgi:regulator of sigma E protease